MDILKDKFSKVSFIGISLSGLSTIESAVAVLDKNLKIIKLDKLFSMSDVKYFIDNFAGVQNSIITISVPQNETMLNAKWKYNSRTYDVVNLDNKMRNRDGWTDRFSTRGCEYFKELKSKNVDIFRFDCENIKQAFNNGFAFKERTPADCKSLQDTLRLKYNMRELPPNMLPVAQLEAIMGAYLAHSLTEENNVFNCKIIGEYETLKIIGV